MNNHEEVTIFVLQLPVVPLLRNDADDAISKEEYCIGNSRFGDDDGRCDNCNRILCLDKSDDDVDEAETNDDSVRFVYDDDNNDDDLLQ